ncbi:MAG: hypothetical protein KatS3mg087_1007 [Patescibacteria group bacterium]|nr:MAG: hypothetical protein KatS3mg087_1007 [Patescibacteria group bacterium]
MIQVNLKHSEPAMWADLVRLAKERVWTTFKYYELSNENDCCEKSVTSTMFWQRARDYSRAMKAVDPKIKVIGPAPAVPSENWNGETGLMPTISNYINPFFASQRAGLSQSEVVSTLDAATWHWYQQALGYDQKLIWNQIQKYAINGYAKEGREFAEKFPRHLDQNALTGPYSNIQQGVTEVNIESTHHYRPYSGSYLAALWFTDRLPALAASGVDFTTAYAGYGGDNAYSITHPIFGGGGGARVRPTFSAFALLANFFGDTIVSSTYTDKENLGVWASRKSNEPNKLYVMVTNFQPQTKSLTVNLQNFTANSGLSYTMRNTNPTVFEEDQCGKWNNGVGGETRKCIAEPVAGATQFVTSINNVALRGASFPSQPLTQQISAIRGVPFTASGTNLTYSFELYTATVLELSSSDISPLPTAAQPSPTIVAASVPPQNRPYKGVYNELPGRIEAENYDEGGAAKAYFDTSAGNSGGQYRSEDVDIESNKVGGFNVGWIEANEWLQYSIQVTQDGPVSVSARVASQKTGGNFSIQLNNSAVAQFNILNTGGWSNWQTVEAGTVNLTQGTYTLKVTAERGNGFSSLGNIDYLSFTQAQNSEDINGDGKVNSLDFGYLWRELK